MKLPQERWGTYLHRQVDDYKPTWKKRTWKENERRAQERRKKYAKSNLEK